MFRRLCVLFSALAALCATAPAQTVPAGYVLVKQSNLVDGNGVVVNNATVCAQVMIGGKPSSVQVGGGGTVISSIPCVNVANGTWSMAMPDMSLSAPKYACVTVTATDNVSGNGLLTGFNCVQPRSVPPPGVTSFWCSGTICNFDQLPPNYPANIVMQGADGKPGPAGPAGAALGLFRGSYAAGVAYSQKDVVTSGSTIYISLLDGNTGNDPATHATQWAVLPMQQVIVNPATSSNPVYLYAHFRQDDETLYLSYSRDAQSFTPINSFGSYRTYMRDPSIYYDPGTQNFYFVASGVDAGSCSGCFNSTTFEFFSSKDLKTFTAVQKISPQISGVSQDWAPEWFTDPVSGNTYAISAVSANSGSTFNPVMVQFNPAAGTFAGVSTQLTVNGTSSGRGIDYFLKYINGTYYMFYADLANDGTQRIRYATSSTLTGTYNTVSSGDYFGFSAYSEAPGVLTLPNGCFRVYADTYVVQASPGGSRRYTPKFVDSCSATPFASLSGAVQPFGVQGAEHGTIISLADQGPASMVYAAGQANPAGALGSPFNVNTATGPYLMNLKSRGTTSNGITNDEPAAIGLDPGSGNVAVLSACDMAGGAKCPLPVLGKAKLIEYTDALGFGVHQFLTAQDKEASACFADGPTSPNGSMLLTGAVCIGENAGGTTPVTDPSSGKTSPGMHKFFVFLESLSESVFTIDPVTGISQFLHGIDSYNAATGHHIRMLADSLGVNLQLDPDGSGTQDGFITRDAQVGHDYIRFIHGTNDVEVYGHQTHDVLAGTGNALVCADSTGKLYRSTTGTCN